MRLLKSNALIEVCRDVYAFLKIISRDRNNPEVPIRHACFTQRHTGINVSPTNVCVECIGSFVMRRIAKSLGKSTRCRSAIVPVGEGPGFNICVSKFGSKYRIRFCLFVNEYLSDNLFKRLNIKSMPCNEYNAKVWRWRAGICSLSIGPQLNPMVAVVQNNLPGSKCLVCFFYRHEALVNHSLFKLQDSCPESSVNACLNTPTKGMAIRKIFHNIYSDTVEIDGGCSRFSMGAMTNKSWITLLK